MVQPSGATMSSMPVSRSFVRSMTCSAVAATISVLATGVSALSVTRSPGDTGLTEGVSTTAVELIGGGAA